MALTHLCWPKVIYGVIIIIIYQAGATDVDKIESTTVNQEISNENDPNLYAQIWSYLDPPEPKRRPVLANFAQRSATQTTSANNHIDENIYDITVPTHILTQLKEKVYYHLRHQSNGLVAGPRALSRSSSGTSGFFDIKKIYYGYGCYCNFGANWKTGKGQPIVNNLIDLHCYNNFMCKSCIELEVNLESTCDPGLTRYAPPRQSKITTLGLKGACQEANPSSSDCVIKVCICDAEFIAQVVKFMLDPTKSFDPAFRHTLADFATPNPEFNPDLDCVVASFPHNNHGENTFLEEQVFQNSYSYSNNGDQDESTDMYTSDFDYYEPSFVEPENQAQNDKTKVEKQKKQVSASKRKLFQNEIETTKAPFLSNEKKCCGEYPKKVLYQTSSGKDCCNGKLFDSLMQTCCDGAVMDVGSC